MFKLIVSNKILSNKYHHIMTNSIFLSCLDSEVKLQGKIMHNMNNLIVFPHYNLDNNEI